MGQNHTKKPRGSTRTVHLLLQGVSDKVDLKEIKSRPNEVEHVKSIHHTHVWSLDGEHHVLTSHLLLEHITSFEQIDGVRVKAMEALKDYDLPITLFR